MRTDDLAPLLTPAGRPEVGYHSGRVLAWDAVTGHNTVEVAGAVLSDLPILNTSEVVALEAGEIVGLLRVGSSYFILGRVIVPGAAELATTVLGTDRAYAEASGIALSSAWTIYGVGAAGSVVTVPPGFTGGHLLMFVSAGCTFTTSGNVTVAPYVTVSTDGSEAFGPAINSGNSSVAVASSFWSTNFGLMAPGDTISFGVQAIRTGTQAAGTGNWHVAASVMFTR